MSDTKLIPEVLEKLNSFESQPFLFVGSGVSLRYLNLENWENLLRKFAFMATNEEYAFEQYKNDCEDGLLDNELFPAIASLIEKDFNRTWYKDEKYKDSRSRFKVYIDRGVSPFKLELANYTLNAESKMGNNQLLQNEVALLKQLGDKSIAGIITTNYDKFIETAFSFSKFIGQEELLFNPSQAVGEIYKIHGCCEKPESIVISTNDYDLFNERNAYLAAKLLTIFLEHPIIFLGYSINDPNIQAILKSIVDCLSQEKLQQLKDRLFFIEWEEGHDGYSMSSHSIQFGAHKSLDMTRVTTGSFEKLFYTLLQNKGKYNVKLLRKLKQDVYDLILSEEPKGCIHVANIEDDTQLEQVEVVIGVGINKEIAELGISAPEAEDLYLDIVYGTGAFNSNIDALVEKRVPQLMKRNSNSLPLWKYLSAYSKEIPMSLQEHLKFDLNGFLSQHAISKKETNPLGETSIKELRENFSDEDCLTQILYLQDNQLSPDELLAFLKDFLDTHTDYLKPANKDGKKTNLKKLIKIYDWMKYGDKKNGA